MPESPCEWCGQIFFTGCFHHDLQCSICPKLYYICYDCVEKPNYVSPLNDTTWTNLCEKCLANLTVTGIKFSPLYQEYELEFESNGVKFSRSGSKKDLLEDAQGWGLVAELQKLFDVT